MPPFAKSLATSSCHVWIFCTNIVKICAMGRSQTAFVKILFICEVLCQNEAAEIGLGSAGAHFVSMVTLRQEKAGKVTPAAKCHAYHICKQTLVVIQKHVQFISFSAYIVGIYCMFSMQVDMEVKSSLEVAFEWFCECGAFEQLRKQCESYTADSTVGFSK